MSNTSIVGRLLDVLGRIHQGQAPTSAFAAALKLHAPAFEGISRETLDRISYLSVKAIQEDVSPIESAQLGLSHSSQSLREAKELLEAIRHV